MEELILKALAAEGILSPNVLAYALATAQHESGMVPKHEIRANPQSPDPDQRKLYNLQSNYEGGWRYHGRGLIQLTHYSNYKAMDERLGLGGALVDNPDLANDPEIAAKILAVFFKDRGVAKLAETGNFYAARWPVNKTDKATQIANTAKKYVSSAKGMIENQPVTTIPTPTPTQDEFKYADYVKTPAVASATVLKGQTQNVSPIKIVKDAYAADKDFSTAIVPTPPVTPRVVPSMPTVATPAVRQVQPIRTSQVSGGTTTISRGQTLSGIARSYNTSLNELLKINPQIKDPNKIYAGDMLYIPTSTVKSTSAKPQLYTPVRK